MLRPIERAISTRDQLVRIVATPRKKRHTDADADLDLTVADVKWLGHQLDKPLRQIGSPLLGLQYRGNDRKLVAAKARKGVAVTKSGSQPTGHHAQQLITDHMAVGVIDLLEMIQIEQQQGAEPLLAAGERERLFQLPL